MRRRCSKGKGKGKFARDETRILASRVSLARACSSLRSLLPSACYAGYANSLLPPCFLVNYFFSLQTVSLFSIFSGMHQSSWKKGSTFTFQSKQTDAGEKLHTLSVQAAVMSRENKLSNVQKWWTKAHLHTLCKQLCGNLLFAVLFYSTGSQRLIHRRELEDLYGKVRLWMKL